MSQGTGTRQTWAETSEGFCDPENAGSSPRVPLSQAVFPGVISTATRIAAVVHRPIDAFPPSLMLFLLALDLHDLHGMPFFRSPTLL